MARKQSILQTELPHLAHHFTYAAMAAAGVAEAPAAEMRLQMFRHLVACGFIDGTSDAATRLHDSLQTQTYAARRRVRGSLRLAAYYESRQAYRDTGRDPNTVPNPWSRNWKEHHARELEARRPPTPQQKEAALRELAARTPPEWRLYKPGQRDDETLFERRQMRMEATEILLARREVDRIDREKAKEVEKLAASLKWEPGIDADIRSPEAMRADAVSQVQAWRELSWSVRVMRDFEMIERLGRPTPRAARHRLASVPPWQRPHRSR
jgi:hypothetical protein